MKPHSPLTDNLVLAWLALGATLAGWGLRTWWGYPLDPSDERNWSAIAAYVASGADWPISGPLHFAATQVLARWLDASPASALALLGVASPPAVLLAYAASYRLVGLTRAWPALLLLCTSTYFWAPLLESRPQQWGQALVMLCTTLAWRGFAQTAATPAPLQRQLWLAWCLLFLVTGWVHLLSSAVVLVLCGVLALGVAVFRPDLRRRVRAWALATLPGLWVMVLPDGPYRRTWFDVGHHQLQLDRPGLWLLGLAAAAATWGLLTLARRWAPVALAWGMAQVQAHPRRWGAALAGGALLPLAVQASLLPAEAWVLYQGSVAQFALRQLGNLFFLACLVRGLLQVATTPALHSDSAWQGLAALLAAVGALALVALLGSSVMTFTNWMLRVINYALPLAAPFAAAGFMCWHAHRVARGLVLAAATGLSLLAAGHPQLVLLGG